MSKKMWPLWLGAGVIGVIGTIGLYSQKAGRAADVTPSAPEKITLQTLQLGKVRWQEGRTVRDLEGRTVLAVVFCEHVQTKDARSYLPPHFVITRPETVRTIVADLLQAKPKNRPGEKNLAVEPEPGHFESKLRFVFDDNTGITIGYTIDPMWREYIGTNWRSAALLRTLARQALPRLPVESGGSPGR
jgi:hypothetical protein